MIKIIYFLTFALIFFTALRRPAVSVSAVLALFAIEQWVQATDVWFVLHSQLTNLIVGTIMVVAFISELVRRGPPFRHYPAAGAVVLTLFFYSLLSTFWAPDPTASLQAWSRTLPYILTFLVLAPLLLNRMEDYQVAISVYLLLGGVLALLLLTTVNWDNRLVVLGDDRISARGNPLAIGTLGANLVVLSMLSTARYRNVLAKLAMYAVALVAIAVLIKSGSRGQLVAALLSLGMFWPLAKGRFSIINSLFLVMGFVAFGFVVMFALDMFWHGHHRYTIEQMSSDMEGRLYLATRMLGYWADDPAAVLIGLGNSSAYTLVGKYPHIVPAEILAEEGLIGFMLWGVIVALGIRAVVGLLNVTRGDPRLRSVAVCYSALLVNTFVLSLKQGSLIGSTLMFFFFIVVAKLNLVVKAEAAAEVQTGSSETPDRPALQDSLAGLPGREASYPRILR